MGAPPFVYDSHWSQVQWLLCPKQRARGCCGWSTTATVTEMITANMTLQSASSNGGTNAVTQRCGAHEVSPSIHLGRGKHIVCHTHNVEHMDMLRLREYVSQMAGAQVHIALLQGLRYWHTVTLIILGYKCFILAAAQTGPDSHAGVAIIVDMKLMQ